MDPRNSTDLQSMPPCSLRAPKLPSPTSLSLGALSLLRVFETLNLRDLGAEILHFKLFNWDNMD